jgi:hypothetical protein
MSDINTASTCSDVSEGNIHTGGETDGTLKTDFFVLRGAEIVQIHQYFDVDIVSYSTTCTQESNEIAFGPVVVTDG